MQWRKKQLFVGSFPPTLLAHPTSCRIEVNFLLFLSSFVKIKYDLGDKIGCQQAVCSILAPLSSFAVFKDLVSNKNKI